MGRPAKRANLLTRASIASWPTTCCYAWATAKDRWTGVDFNQRAVIAQGTSPNFFQPVRREDSCGIRQALIDWARGRCWIVAAPPSGGRDVSVEASGEIGSHPCRPNSACRQMKGRLNRARTTAPEDRLWNGCPGDSFEGETEMSPPFFSASRRILGNAYHRPTRTGALVGTGGFLRLAAVVIW